MKKTLIVLVSVMALCVASMQAQGLDQFGSTMMTQPKASVGTYSPKWKESNTPKGLVMTSRSYVFGGHSLTYGKFVSAQEYIAGVSVSPVGDVDVPVRRAARPDPFTYSSRVPLPEGTWMLLVLAAGYMGYVAIRRRRAQA